jgi:hypothetical protein
VLAIGFLIKKLEENLENVLSGGTDEKTEKRS